MIDIAALRDLPLPLAIIIVAFYLINSNNAEFAKKLIALIAEFTGKYEAILATMAEERKVESNRWLERDRILNERLEKNTEALVKNANETHQLRNVVQPLVLSVDAQRRARGSSSPKDTGD